MKQFVIDVIGKLIFLFGYLKGKCNAKDSMRIILLLPLTTVGGVELVHLDILRAISKHNCETFFWYRYNPWMAANGLNDSLEKEYAKFGPVNVLEDQVKSRFDNWQRKYLIGQFFGRINKKDKIVIVRNGDEQFKSALKQIKKKFKLIVVTHNSIKSQTDWKRLYHYLDADINDKIDKRVIISESLKIDLLELFNHYKIKDNKRFKTICNSVQIDNQLFKKESSVLNVLFAGRDVDEKRFYLIYDIARRMVDKQNIHFHFVGPNADKYEQLPNATFYGEVMDQQKMHEIYRATNIFLLLSKSEGFPRSIAEAMGCGNIIIATNVGAIKDHISSKNGKLVTSTNDEEIKSEVFSTLINFLNSANFDRTSQNNYEYAMRKFSFETFSREYNNLIDELS
ncbi:MAG: glycosyltransferase family 4 protein [Bacteroidota bacterium]